jgi:hypothetical protein
MSYLQQFRKRIDNILPEDLASILITMDKWAVDYDKMSKSLLSKFFDFEGRGVPCIVRSLFDRVDQVKNTISRKSQKGYLTDTEMRVKILKNLIDDAKEKAIVMTFSYLECIELLDGPKAQWVEILHQVGHYFSLALLDQLEEFLKYQTASLCALVLSNECDQKPDCVLHGHWRVGDFLPYCARVTHWLRRHCLKRRSKLSVKVAFSVYHTKRVAPALSENFVQKALDKNLKALTEERPLPDKIVLREQVIRTVRELHYYANHPVIGPLNKDHDRADEVRNCKLYASRYHHKIPSLSACYENVRSKGGSLGYLLKKFDLLKECRTPGSHVLLGFVECSDRFSTPVPCYGVLDEEEQDQLMRPSLDGYGRRVMVRREPILEPFKVRIISKGEAIPYQRAQNYQPFLWKLIQTADCFALTGRPVRDHDLCCLAEFARSTRQHCVLVSGDYSAATDNLHPWLCDEALREICHLFRIPYEDALNLSSCLTKHRIDDRSCGSYKLNKLTGRISDDEGSEYNVAMDGIYEQIWGQLMGSPVSFPILCIINAAVTRHAMERSFDREISLRDGAFLVNGDDVLFPIPSGQYQTWVSAVTSAGLSPSVGKNYVNRRYGVINSQVYDFGNYWDLAGEVVSVSKLPLVKMNLVYCQQHETTERRKDENLFFGEVLRHGKTLEGRMNELVSGFEGDDRDRLLRRAYHYAKPILTKLPNVSWVLPKALGGLGLPMITGHEVSDLHLKIASLILCTHGDARRKMVKLQWLREPGFIFCDETNEQIAELNELLGNHMELVPEGKEDKVYSRLIKSNLGLGIDTSILDFKGAIKRWDRIYKGWVRSVKQVKWLLPHEDGVGVHRVSFLKAMSFGGQKWSWSSSVRWVGGI